MECALLVRVCEKRRELRAAVENEDGKSEASIDMSDKPPERHALWQSS